MDGFKKIEINDFRGIDQQFLYETYIIKSRKTIATTRTPSIGI